MSSMSRRRLLLAATSIAAAATAPRIVFAQGAMAPTGPFKLDPLRLPDNALEPHIDAKTMEIHHDRHHQAYVNNLNNFAKDNPQIAAKPVHEILASLNDVPEAIRTGGAQQLGGHANHTMFWQIMGPDGGKPEGECSPPSTATSAAWRSCRPTSMPRAAACSAPAGCSSPWRKDGKLAIETRPTRTAR